MGAASSLCRQWIYRPTVDLEVKHTLLQKEHNRTISDMNHLLAYAQKLEHRISQLEHKTTGIQNDLQSVMENDMIVLSTR